MAGTSGNDLAQFEVQSGGDCQMAVTACYGVSDQDTMTSVNL